MKQFFSFLSLIVLSLNVGFAQATVTGVVPANNALNVSPATAIQVTFSEAMLPTSFNDMTSFIVRGITSGRHLGSFVFGGGNTVATFTPTVPFMKGEIVVVDISSNLQNAGSVAITPFVYTFTVGVNSSAGTLAAKVDYATGTGPYSVFIGDVDNDGDGDIAVANRSSNTVSILKNNGDGTFAAKVDYTTGGGPESVFISDVDGDGDGDLAVGNVNSNTISILKNNGDGTFAAKTDYAAGDGLFSLFISDLDGDGDGDIAASNYSFNAISILKNNGDGTFAAKVDYPTGNFPASVFVSDLDGDGDADLAAACFSSNTVSILKNNGNGTFAAKVDYPTGTNPFSVFISDVDGDGDGDLVVANLNSSSVSILKNNGNGTLAAKVDYLTGGSPVSVFISDVDGDGDGDLAIANYNTNTASIVKNNGDGTFAASTHYMSGGIANSVFVSDLDGDGVGDVVVANSSSNTVSILKGNASPTNPAVTGAANPSTVTAGNATLLTGTVTPGTNPTSTGLTVRGDLSSIGGSPIQQFYDNQTNGDITSGDNIFSFSSTVTPATTAGLKSLPLTVNDAQTRMGVGSISLTVTPPSFTITATAEANGDISPSGNVVVSSGSNQAFIISANTGYHIDSVVVDGANQGPITDYEFLNVTTNHTIDAYFSINTYTLAVNTVGNGSVTKAPDQLTYNHGAIVQLEAIPALGYVFDGWSGDATGTDDPLDVVMNGDKNITATFTIDPQYEAFYRTATYNDWATAVDGKGKFKSIKRKSDKVRLKFNIGAPANATGFTLKFSMAVRGAVTIGKDKSIQLGDSILNVKTAAFTGLTIAVGDTFQFDGWGAKGKQAAVKVVWDASPKLISQAVTEFKFNDPKLPMPNYHNVGEELFPAGFGQVSAFFPTGLLVGIPQGSTGARSVLHLKYKDVQKSLVKVAHGVPTFHADSIRCLDTFTVTRKPISKQQKFLPPDKGRNILFAELLTLKLNIAASVTLKFPLGFGELTFNDPSDPANPFNGQTVNEIVAKADTLITCLPLTSKLPLPSLADLSTLLNKLNGSFAGVIDTFSFSTKTQLKGVTRLIDVPFLRKTPGVQAVTFLSGDVATETVPEQMRLGQNYPNPFNPTTTIDFELASPSRVSLKIYNVMGQEVAVLLTDEDMEEGRYDVDFNAEKLSSGVYFYRLAGSTLADEEFEAGSFQIMKKMLLVK